jgi:hypothetical protein
MARLRREFGFWGSLGRMRLSDLATVEVASGLLIGAGLAAALDSVATRSARIAVAGDYLALAGALLGIVFAGFALVIALMSDDYIRWLQDTDSGVAGFLRPFMISVGLQLGTLIGVVVYRAIADQLPRTAELWFFGVVSVLFFVAALDIISLARSVLLHGVARARGLQVQDLEAARKRDRLAK